LPDFAICARLHYWFELSASSAQNFNLFIAMKRALIATLFNEADNCADFLDSHTNESKCGRDGHSSKPGAHIKRPFVHEPISRYWA
jgi:hypothetical protein